MKIAIVLLYNTSLVQDNMKSRDTTKHAQVEQSSEATVHRFLVVFCQITLEKVRTPFPKLPRTTCSPL